MYMHIVAFTNAHTHVQLFHLCACACVHVCVCVRVCVVFHWTSEQVVQWLTVYVELPQYKDIFYKLNITGRHLPRLVGGAFV